MVAARGECGGGGAEELGNNEIETSERLHIYIYTYVPFARKMIYIYIYIYIYVCVCVCRSHILIRYIPTIHLLSPRTPPPHLPTSPKPKSLFVVRDFWWMGTAKLATHSLLEARVSSFLEFS
jgi:hypothetical protein